MHKRRIVVTPGDRAVAGLIAGAWLVYWIGVWGGVYPLDPATAWRRDLLGFLLSGLPVAYLLHRQRSRTCPAEVAVVAGRAQAASQTGQLGAAQLACLQEIREYAVITVDKARRIQLFNSGAERTFGYSAAEVLGTTLDCILPEGYFAPGRRRLQDVCRVPGGVIIGRRKDGVQVPLAAAVSRCGHGSRLLYTLILRDCSEHAQLHDQLRLSARLFEHSTEGIVITDARGRILSVNNTFSALSGYEPKEAIGRLLAELSARPHHPAFYAEMRSVLARNGYWEGEIWDRCKNGKVVTVHARVRAIRDENNAVSNYLVTLVDITAAKLSEQRLKHLTHYDELTGLPNRLSFQDHLQLAMSDARQAQRELGILFIDLDRFKLINDSIGHAVGDRLLVAAGERLKQCVRSEDIVARLGGDEFAIIVKNLLSEQDASIVAEKVLNDLSEPFSIDGHELRITASIGVSLFPADGHDVQSLMKAADTAMFRAKEQGRNSFQVYKSAMNAASLETLMLENNLRKALQQDELQVYYQPKLDFGSGRIVGLEALARWRHADLGDIPPSQFIPLAEETGLIIPLGERILREACRQHQSWRRAGLPPISIAVNLSPRQFKRRSLVQDVDRIVRETGMDPRYLELEITESGVMEDADFTIDTLRELRAMGITVTIDDFGTGYSSLSYLKRFPINNIKIDRSFVQDISHNPDSAAITTAIVALARSLNLKTIAEGVETLAQLDYLHRLQCDELQGYIFSPPQPAEQMTNILQRFLSPREETGQPACGIRSVIDAMKQA